MERLKTGQFNFCLRFMLYNRISYRLKGYNYSQNGYYFITINTKLKINYFGKIVNNGIKLSVLGHCALSCWKKIPKHFPFVKLDSFVIMPNHVHGIIIIEHPPVWTQDFASIREGNKFGPQSKNLASIVRGYKIGVTKFAKNNQIEFQWHHRFYDEIIRNEQHLYNVREYIKNNPGNWKSEKN